MHVFETPGQVDARVSIAEGAVEVSCVETGAGTGAGGSGRVEVHVEPLRNNAASREAVEQTRVELVEHSGIYEIVVDAPKRWIGFGRGASIGVRISCPFGTRLDVSTASADVRATGRLGQLDAKTASGDLGFDAVDGDVRVATASGDVSIAEIGGSGTVKSASGDVAVRICRGQLSINLASGDVQVGRALAGVSLGSASGDLEVGSVESGEIRLQSVSGDVRVGVREGLRVWIDASSVSGSISSDLPSEEGPPAEGGAALEIRARTVSGDVRIVSAAGVAAA
ncbi:MAG: DUF4097 family beta strand repeat-containing protein [Gaiellaceae bacterium]